ncbi:MAG: ribosome biogenesis GTP-binding protein YihA/YsxC [Nitrospinales bacterium]
MKIISAEFIISAVSARQYPPGALPEFAFVGRSNVGKSSLINSLVRRKKLVKTSATPGKTQMINFFRINDLMIFADLPGYGYAKVPAAVKRKWKKLVEHYLLNRETLIAVIFIIDIRRGFTDLDLDLKDWLEASGIDYIPAVTKSDKLSQRERSKQLKKIAEALPPEVSAEITPYSSKTHRGRKELWRQIKDRIQHAATARKPG